MQFDDIVIGAGMGGLTVASLLAKSGRRVLVLEAHDQPGGYAHTFRTGKYRFCAQVHYIFGCGAGEPVSELVTRLGLADEVKFHRLDPEGFDHVVVAGERFRIPNGLPKFRDRLVARFPEHARPLDRYFETVTALGREMDGFPDDVSLVDYLTAPFRFPNLLRHKSATLGDLFERISMPMRLRAILAGQAGDYLLPPSEVSLILHVALVRAYDRGAYYPEKHYFHFIESIAKTIADAPGCKLLLETEVARIETEKGRASRVVTTRGDSFTAERIISNVDPQATARLLPPRALPKSYEKKLAYEYSGGTITIYLAVKGIDLRDHGFGSWNVWHYPSDDLDALYRRQTRDHDLDDPWLFMSTPTLHTNEPGLCPPGEQLLEIATSADHSHFSGLRAIDRKTYNKRKKALRERILSIVEARYVPGLRAHVSTIVMGTPATNERFCMAPRGNSYGAALTPANVGPSRLPFETPIPNLFLVGATAGYPSIGGTVQAGLLLAKKLLGARIDQGQGVVATFASQSPEQHAVVH